MSFFTAYLTVRGFRFVLITRSFCVISQPESSISSTFFRGFGQGCRSHVRRVCLWMHGAPGTAYTVVIPIVLHSAARKASYVLKKSWQRGRGRSGLAGGRTSLTGPIIKVMKKITFKPDDQYRVHCCTIHPLTVKTFMQPGPDKYYPENQQML